MYIDLINYGMNGKGDHFLCGITTMALIRDENFIMLVDTGSFRSRDHILKAIEQRGLTVDDITHVFITHCHWDHVMNMECFPNATFFVPRLDYEHCANLPAETWGIPPYLYEMCRGLKLELLEPVEQELFPGVRTVLLHGHSVGQQGLLVETDEGTALFPGDGVWSARSILRGRPDVVFVNVEEAIESVNRAVAQADIIYPGHDRPFKYQDGEISYWFDAEYKFRFAFDPDGEDMELVINTRADNPQDEYYQF